MYVYQNSLTCHKFEQNKVSIEPQKNKQLKHNIKYYIERKLKLHLQNKVRKTLKNTHKKSQGYLDLCS